MSTIVTAPIRRTSQLKAGALLSYLTVFVNIAAGLLYTPWMIKSIGNGHYGLYTLSVAVINLFLMDFGLGSAVSKFLSRYYACNDQAGARDFLGVAYKIYGGLSAIAFLVLTGVYFFIDAIYVKLTPDEIAVFKQLYIIISAYSVISFPFLSLNGILLSNEKFIALKMCNLIQKVFTVTLIAFALILGYGVYALVAVNAAGCLIFTGIKLVIVRKANVKVNMRCRKKGLAKDIFAYSLWITVAQLASRCIFLITPTILGIFLGSWEITIFGLASTLEGYTYVFADSMNGMLMPSVTRLVAKGGDSGALTDLMIKVGRLQVYLIGLIVIGFACVGQSFVINWMGEDYALVYACALLMMLPGLLDMPQQIGRTAVQVADHAKLQAYIYAVMAIVNIAMSAVLSKYLGVMGACVSIFLAYMMRSLGMNIVYHKALHIDVLKYFRDAYARWLVPAAITVLAGVVLNMVLRDEGWIGVAIKTLLLTLIYLAGIYTLSMNTYERNTVGGMVKRIRQFCRL